MTAATNAPPKPRYNPEVYHERRSSSPIADMQLEYVALQHDFLGLQERLVLEVERTRRYMERLNRLQGAMSLLVQAVETGNDRRAKKTGPPLQTTGPASPGDPS
jgi:hypothetical protein